MIKRPMKAPSKPITDDEFSRLKFPVACSAKLDGIRALCTGKEVLSSTLKRIGNRYIQECLSHPEYEGLDGELIVGSPTAVNEIGMSTVFNTTTGAVRRADGKPDFKLYVFDDFGYPKLSYKERWLKYMNTIQLPHVIVLEQRLVRNTEEAFDYEAELLEKGYEGMMPRTLDGHYKEGRATAAEKLIYKRTPWLTDEAEIVGFVEQMENQNEQVTNKLGTSSRSSHKENLVPKGTLGALILKSKLWKEPFRCTGEGLTADVKQEIWDNRPAYLHQIGTYKYKGYGSIEKPRQPIWKGLRLAIDITSY